MNTVICSPSLTSAASGPVVITVPPPGHGVGIKPLTPEPVHQGALFGAPAGAGGAPHPVLARALLRAPAGALPPAAHLTDVVRILPEVQVHILTRAI